MSQSAPPRWPESWPDFRHTSPNGSQFEIGLLLGELRTEGRLQTEILLSMLDEQRELPDKLASRIQPLPAAYPAAKADCVSQWAELLKALWPLALILALVAGKISAPEALPLVRHMLGVHA